MKGKGQVWGRDFIYSRYVEGVVSGEGLRARNQTQKEFSLFEKQEGQWLEGCEERILGRHQKGE